MSTNEQAVSDNSGEKSFPKKSLLIGLLCVCGLTLVFVVFNMSLKTKPVSIRIDEYVENFDEARKEADDARNAWESHREERENAEIAQLKAMNIPDLSKKAVGILVKAEKPEYIVNKAIVTTEKEMNTTIVIPKWDKKTDPDKNVFWSIVYRETMDQDHDWWIEHNNMFGQYRLVGYPHQHLYFSIKEEAKLQTVLTYIVIFGNTKSFYQVVCGDTFDKIDCCEVLDIATAGKFFPETLNLAEGVYAKHPCNPYALVPVANFFANLATTKDCECIVLLGRMGAKSVHVSRTEGEAINVGVGGKGYSMGYGAHADAELAKGMKAKRDLKVVFSGNSRVEPSPTLLENSIWHKDDAQLNAILSTRLSGNNTKEWHFTEEMQLDYNFDFRAAASILGIAEAELRARFEKERQIQRTFHVLF